MPEYTLEQKRLHALKAGLDEDLPMVGRGNRFIPISPHPKQRLFLDLDDEREALFGGATGGGKTIALLADALKYVHIKDYSALLLRKNFPDLKQEGGLIEVSKEWLSNTDAKWNEQDKEWSFPNKSKLRFGYLETENDKYRYQGGEYQYIGFDEITQFTESQYRYLFSRLRKKEGLKVPLRMRGATNPGGVGGQWVYQRFIPEDFDPTQAREIRVWEKRGVDERGKACKRVFVPSLLDDNPSLDRDSYLESLDQLDEITRQQYLSGDWLIQVRGDILYTYSEAHTVITWEQFAEVFGQPDIPAHWLLSCYQDFGTTVNHPCVTSWFATAGMNAPRVHGVPMSRKVFLYRGLMLNQCTANDVAGLISQAMAQRGEVSRCERWQMSHEASSERLEYQRQGLPFVNWPTGKTRGVEQLKNAFALTDLDKPHPFKPSLQGCPSLFLIVDKDEIVNPKTERGLARWRAEILAYHWASLKTGEVMTRLEPYALFNDACFPAGTLITTLRGAIPIETVTASDVVLTRQGYKPTSGAMMTDVKGKTNKYVFSDGTILEGTANHPIWINGQFIRMDSMRVCDTMRVWTIYNPAYMPKWSPFKVLTFIGILCRRAGMCGIILIQNTKTLSVGLNRYILRFGERMDVRFQKGFTFITRISTLLTTPSLIWNASPRATTQNAIKSDGGFLAHPHGNYATWHAFGQERLNGIKVQRGDNGIKKTVNHRGKTANLYQRFVSGAARIIRRLLTSPDTAPRDVRLVAVGREKVQPVYNLSVSNVPEYFANGILVHNCDTMRAAAADYFPDSLDLTKEESIQKHMPEHLVNDKRPYQPEHDLEVIFARKEAEKKAKAEYETITYFDLYE